MKLLQKKGKIFRIENAFDFAMGKINIIPSFRADRNFQTLPLAALLPCFATFTPSDARINVEMVEVLMRVGPEPPVP